MRDCMLPHGGSLPDDDWVRAFLDKEATMALFPHLAATCKEWRDIVFGSPEYAALRVAMADLLQLRPHGISPVGSRSRKRKISFVLRKYELACFFLCCPLVHGCCKSMFARDCGRHRWRSCRLKTYIPSVQCFKKGGARRS